MIIAKSYTRQSPDSPEPIQPEIIPGFEQLLKAGAKFYPIGRDKKPAARGRLHQIATDDPCKIAAWKKNTGVAGIAARIGRGCSLLVIDLEDPNKHPGHPGPDGFVTFGDLLEEHGITRPTGPRVQTGSGGMHIYFRLPPGRRIRTHISLWGGVDVLASGANVVLPGSETAAGNYTEIAPFDSCEIPWAPKELLKLIVAQQKAVGKRSKLGKRGFKPSVHLSEFSRMVVDRRTWYRLSRNPDFRRLWDREKIIGDTTPSAYAYQLAGICACNGLAPEGALSVICKWRSKHGLKTLPTDRKKIIRVIIPGAFENASKWVDDWNREREMDRTRRKANSTRERIVAVIRDRGPQSPAQIAEQLELPREVAKKALQRLYKTGELVRTTAGYSAPKSGNIVGQLRRGRQPSKAANAPAA